MIKGGELSFETQLKIKFLPPNNGSKQCLEKSLCKKEILFSDYSDLLVLKENNGRKVSNTYKTDKAAANEVIINF